MYPEHIPEFQSILKRMASVFRVRTDTEDFRGIASSYFRALSRHDLGDLERGADAWIAKADKFPKPYEWAQAIPKESIPLPVMTDSEARAWAEAERQMWEREPCQCRECKNAGVDWKPQRFVPEFTRDDTEHHVRDPLKDRIVTAGHWTHGQELAGYYRAKGEFYQKCAGLGLKIEKVIPKKKPRVKERSEMTQVGR